MPLKYAFGQDRLVADFVARSKLASGFSEWGSGFADKNLKAIGIANDDDELIAGIVYFNYHPEAETIEMSVEALPKQRWLTPTTLAIMFQYPFLQCGCQALFTKTSARNRHVLRMLAAMNFRLILVPRAGGRNEDGVVALLTIEDWMAGKFCKRYGHHVIEAKTEQRAA
jgi:RimJ/RimL family protein N-acetyltransferase